MEESSPPPGPPPGLGPVFQMQSMPSGTMYILPQSQVHLMPSWNMYNIPRGNMYILTQSQMQGTQEAMQPGPILVDPHAQMQGTQGTMQSGYILVASQYQMYGIQGVIQPGPILTDPQVHGIQRPMQLGPILTDQQAQMQGNQGPMRPGPISTDQQVQDNQEQMRSGPILTDQQAQMQGNQGPMRPGPISSDPQVQGNQGQMRPGPIFVDSLFRRRRRQRQRNAPVAVEPLVQTQRHKLLQYIQYPLSPEDLDATMSHFDSIATDTGVRICYSSDKESITIRGFLDQIVASKNRIEAILPNYQRMINECCICNEDPMQKEEKVGLFEKCDHVACFTCIMEWRQQNRQVSREARLGCPLCRTLSHIITPYPEVLTGDLRLAAIDGYKDQCKQTPCRWSTQGQPCPAGRHCLYDHTRSPQVIERPRIIRFSEFFEESDGEDFSNFLLQGGIHVYPDSDAESLDFSDQELAEAMAALRRARAGTGRARHYPRRQRQ